MICRRLKKIYGSRKCGSHKEDKKKTPPKWSLFLFQPEPTHSKDHKLKGKRKLFSFYRSFDLLSITKMVGKVFFKQK